MKIQNHQSPILSFTSEIIQDLQQWNEGTQWTLRIHGHTQFFLIFVLFFCLLKKNVGTERSPISLMTIILHRTKAVISPIIPLYIVKWEIKLKKTHPVHQMIYLNNRVWALYQQKSCNIACPAEITIHIQIPLRFPLSLSFSLSNILIIIHLSNTGVMLWENRAQNWLLDKNISG